MPQFQSILNSITPASTRFDRLEGREHIVVPMVMITEGVHNGSRGPVLYTDEQLGKFPGGWNSRPVVVYHPSLNNGTGSANHPDEMNARKVGVVLNTRHDRYTIEKREVGRLPAEAWMEPTRLDAIDGRIMANLESSTATEVSTGLFANYEAKPGTWHDEEYSLIATDIQADHLALLPDKVGACSLDDGAGLLVNEQALIEAVGKDGVFPLVQRALGLTLAQFAANMKSHGQTYTDLSALLKERLQGEAWIQDVYDDFIIVDHGGHLWRLDYTKTKDTVSLVEEKPVQVVQVREYRKVDGGGFVGNQTDEPQTEENPVTREERIAALVANAGTAYTAADSVWLVALNDDQFEKLEASAADEAPVAPPAADQPAPAANAQPAAPAAPVAPKALTVKEYITAAPPEVAAMLNQGMKAVASMRQRLISTITANAEDLYTEDQLGGMDTEQLEKVAALATRTAAPAQNSGDQFAPFLNYEGAAGGPADGHVAHNEEALPSVDWD